MLKDYKVILVHPWQYEHTIRNKYKEWLQDYILISTPFQVPSKVYTDLIHDVMLDLIWVHQLLFLGTLF
jgi:hypothetical protein